MKKGIIAVSLLLSGALLITPITNALSKSDEKETTVKPVKIEQNVQSEKIESTDKINEVNNKTTQTNDIDKQETYIKENKKEDTVKEESIKENIIEDKVQNTQNTTEEKFQTSEQKEDLRMSKSQAEAVLNKYLNEVEKTDLTYTYQGDENTFESIKEKGIRGYVFLPNVDTDMAYLVDKDNGNIYFFHPSGYFELLQ
ncbi:MAG: hypothetical protein ACLSWP_07235 [Terrisporobacter sp.]|jgi:hypothetical protein|uniref:hypothetical protein n=1 Tax=Terrisporobacter sp. TaxID=1965305 RepID=UPI00280B6D59|nr:hypothetical protein [uncultured Terrisporobacter sp.]